MPRFSISRWYSDLYFSDCLHVTDVIGLLQRSQPVFSVSRAELLPHIAVISCFRYRPHDCRIVEFLILVEVLATGHSCRVEMSEVRNISTYAGNYITLHDLHVVDIVEQ